MRRLAGVMILGLGALLPWPGLAQTASLPVVSGPTGPLVQPPRGFSQDQSAPLAAQAARGAAIQAQRNHDAGVRAENQQIERQQEQRRQDILAEGRRQEQRRQDILAEERRQEQRRQASKH